jgi:streptomycin 6-kinase
MTTGDERWIERLPGLLTACAERWELAIGKRLSGGLVGHVFACTTSDGRQVVLKLNPPSAASYAGEPEHEAAALRAWAGRGAVELLDFAADLGALLTRRALPGTPLDERNEARALEIVDGVLASLFRASVPRAGFRSLRGVVDRFLTAKLAAGGEAKELLQPRIEEARLSAHRLARSASKQMLLHGDLMDKNLLRDGDRFVAIDPMPSVGDPHSDLGFWAATRSPPQGLDARAEALARRLGLEPARAARWAAVYAVGLACESWRPDTAELRAWVQSARAQALLRP